MKRPSMYPRHEASLKAFIDRFNSVQDELRLVMQIYQTENYRDDGVIVDTQTGKRVTFDWEIRDKHFVSGEFAFDTLGQFERKLKKDEIDLSIQCDQDETAVMVAWHEDWLKEPRQNIKLSTDDQKHPESGSIRYTKEFKIYPFEKLDEFRSMIHRALQTGTLNFTVFE